MHPCVYALYKHSGVWTTHKEGMVATADAGSGLVNTHLRLRYHGKAVYALMGLVLLLPSLTLFTPSTLPTASSLSSHTLSSHLCFVLGWQACPFLLQCTGQTAPP